MGYTIWLDIFGAPKIDLSKLKELTKDAPEIIVWAAPIMFFFVLLEWYISYRQNRKLYQRAETLGSILVGLGNVVIAFLLKFVLLAIIVVVYNLVPWRN